MANDLSIQVEAHHVAGNAERIEGVSGRLSDSTLAFAEIQARLLAVERRLWASFPRGHLVHSGALRASLTEERAPGAIREVHPDNMVFGTSIEYAAFHPEILDIEGRFQVARRARDIIVDFLVGDAA